MVDGRSLQQWIASTLGQVHETARDLQLGPRNFTRTWMLTDFPEGPACLGRLNRLMRFFASDPAAKDVQVRVTHHFSLPASRITSGPAGWLLINRLSHVLTSSEFALIPHSFCRLAK